ncbi:MAG: acetyl-CoA acetyltransferase [Planctomycetota bacterium]|nr:MAG: acetyl-CoA acetyltransferase [Planctomycetota bacterium]
MSAATDRIVVCSAARTPIGKFMGGLQSVSAVELGVIATQAALQRAGASGSDVQQVIFGMARQAGSGPNVARQVAIRAGIPDSGTAITINQACASGLRAITMAAQEIRSGNSEAVIAGGTESMSRIPFLLPNMRQGYRLGHAKLLDGNFQDGFHCPLVDAPMGSTAETLAERHDISRAEQDAFAVESQRRTEEAQKAGRFADEIAPVTVKTRKGETVVDTDEHPRHGASVEGLAKLPAVFKKDGTVHAGNSSGITDGAAALLVTTEANARAKGWPVLAALTADSMAGVDPAIMGIGPVPALRKLEERSGVKLADVDLIELNEAFAAQIIACDRELGLDMSRVNVNGGAIALGHPIGATGARIAVTLLHEMQRRESKRGVATLCVSGGMGIAALFERI